MYNISLNDKVIQKSITFTPVTLLVSAGFFCFIIVSFALYFLLATPYLNIQLNGWESSEGFSVASPGTDSGNKKNVEVVRGFYNDELGYVPVSKFTNTPDPDIYGNYRAVNEFLAEQSKLWDLINSDRFWIAQ